MSIAWISPITASMILLAGMVDDLRSRKVHNELVVICALLGIAASAVVGGWAGTLQGCGGLATALVLSLPMVAAGVIGAGDMKLLMAFGLAVSWTATYNVLLFAIIWGGIFGVIKIALQGELSQLFRNFRALLRKRATKADMHHIPFTVAILLGWLSYLKLNGSI